MGDPPEVRWGLAEFAAAEELGRARGFWWAPDGESLLVERYDESAVRLWHIADPAQPEAEPARMRYPQAGTDNALVSLALRPHARGPASTWTGAPTSRSRGRSWSTWPASNGAEGRPLLSLFTRDQARLELREVDPTTGGTTLVRALTDDAWVELLAGTPRRLDDGRLLHGVDLGETRHLALDGTPFSPEGVQVRQRRVGGG